MATAANSEKENVPDVKRPTKHTGPTGTVSGWSCDQVSSWVCSLGPPIDQYASNLCRNGVDGPTLLLIVRDITFYVFF